MKFKQNCNYYAEKLATSGLNKVVILYMIEETCSLFHI